MLLQSPTAFIITKCDDLLLQSTTDFLLQSAIGIVKCDRAYSSIRLCQRHPRASYHRPLQNFTNWLVPIHIQLFYSRQHYHTLQRCSFKELTRGKDKQYVISQYPECFNAVGGFQGEYHVVLYHSLPPVVHPPRRVTFSLKNYIKKELDEKLH